jgi:hypothetical protein
LLILLNVAMDILSATLFSVISFMHPPIIWDIHSLQSVKTTLVILNIFYFWIFIRYVLQFQYYVPKTWSIFLLSPSR